MLALEKTATVSSKAGKLPSPEMTNANVHFCVTADKVGPNVTTYLVKTLSSKTAVQVKISVTFLGSGASFIAFSFSYIGCNPSASMRWPRYVTDDTKNSHFLSLSRRPAS